MAKPPQIAKRDEMRGRKLSASASYESDFHAWLGGQARALRSHDSELLDWDHLAEEIEAMAASQRRELTSDLKTLLVHLLKWKWHSGKRSLSWRNSIENARDDLSDLLEESPSLRGKIAETLPKAYSRAIREAANEMGYDDQRRKKTFPHHCPWSFEQLMDESFWPEAAATETMSGPKH